MQCKKSAFDNEVLAVHDLLRHQQTTIEKRLEDALTQAKSFTEAQLQHEIRNFVEFHKVEWNQIKQDHQERSSQLATTQQELLSQIEHKLLKRIEEEVQNNTVTTAKDTTETKAWVREAQEEFTQRQQIQVMSLRAEQETASQRMKEDLEHQVCA